jgi:predicted RND superfamily exporter protein
MNVLIRFRWLFLLLILGVTLLGLKGLAPAMVPNNSLNVWFMDSDPALAKYYDFQRLFGNDEFVMIHTEFPEGVLNQQSLDELKVYKLAIEKVSGVKKVHDITDFMVSLTLQELIEQKANQLIQNYYLNEDATQTMLWVEMAVSDNFDAERQSIINNLEAVLDEHLADRSFHLGGIGLIYVALNEVTEDDFGVFLGLGFLLMFLVMGWVFRSAIFAFTAMMIVTIALLIMYGVYGITGNQINMVTSVLPIIVLVLGITDIVHFPVAYTLVRKNTPDLPARDAAKAALQSVFWPCLLTTMTTTVGFLTLVSTSLSALRDLGLFAAIGILVAFINTLVLMTIAYIDIPLKLSLPRHHHIDAMLKCIRDFVQSKTQMVWGIIILIMVLSVAGASYVKVDTLTLDYLPDSHRASLDHHAIEDKWGPYNVLEFVIRPDEDYLIDDVEIVDAIDQFMLQAFQLPEIHHGLSISTVYQEVGKLDPEALSLSLELKTDKERFNPVATFQTEDGRYGRLKLVGNMLSAQQLTELLNRLDKIAVEAMGDLGTIEPSGYLPLYTQIIDYIMQSQIQSFGLALACIFIFMLVGFRSVRLAVIGTFSNLFPVLVMFGVMGFSGINLDIATASIAAIVIGISIDDTIHFLWSWRQAERLGYDWQAALKFTFNKVGRPVTITTVLLFSGFAILMAGAGATVFYFGLLTCVAALAALFGDLLLLPSIMKFIHKPVNA